jgi:hypothetical protein
MIAGIKASSCVARAVERVIDGLWDCVSGQEEPKSPPPTATRSTTGPERRSLTRLPPGAGGHEQDREPAEETDETVDVLLHVGFTSVSLRVVVGGSAAEMKPRPRRRVVRSEAMGGRLPPDMAT